MILPAGARRPTVVSQALGRVQGVPQDQQKDYLRIARRLPALVRTAGLAQALSFAVAKTEGEGGRRLLDDLAAVLDYTARQELADESCAETDLLAYIRLTDRVLEALDWFKRFAQGAFEPPETGTPGETAPEAGG